MPRTPENQPTCVSERLTLDAVPADNIALREAFTIATRAGVRITQVTVGDTSYRSVTYEPLRGDAITDEAGSAICAFDSISRLLLFQTRITDKTVRNIAKSQSQSLTHLSLLATNVTDASVVELCSKCTKLEDLVVSETQITDQAVESISQLPHLRNLRIAWTPLTDDGLKLLSGMESLELLVLMGTKISDEGLVHLHGHKKLRCLLIGRTAVTPEGIRALKAATPQLQVDFETVDRVRQ